MNKSSEYFYIDINIKSHKLVAWGKSDTASLTGETNNKEVHRIFLTQGQYNKLIKLLTD